MGNLPLGKFTCEFTLEVVRPPVLEREQRDGVTYLVARNYELAYRQACTSRAVASFPSLRRLSAIKTGKSLSETRVKNL